MKYEYEYKIIPKKFCMDINGMYSSSEVSAILDRVLYISETYIIKDYKRYKSLPRIEHIEDEE